MKVGAEEYYKNLGIRHYSALRRYCQVPTDAGTGENGVAVTEFLNDY